MTNYKFYTDKKSFTVYGPGYYYTKCVVSYGNHVGSVKADHTHTEVEKIVKD